MIPLDTDVVEAFTVNQAIDYAGCCRSSLYAWVKMGRLTKHHTANGSTRFLKSEIDAILKDPPKKGMPKGGWVK